MKKSDIEKEFYPDKEDSKDYSDEFEKGDFLAIMIAMASYMFPIAIGMISILFFIVYLWLRFYA